MTKIEDVTTSIKKIEIESGSCRKLIVDGKEVDLSKLISVNITFDCAGINLQARTCGIELPYK